MQRHLGIGKWLNKLSGEPRKALETSTGKANIMNVVEEKDDERFRALFIKGLFNYNWVQIKEYFKRVHKFPVKFVKHQEEETKVVFMSLEAKETMLNRLNTGRVTINGKVLSGEEHYITRNAGFTFEEEDFDDQEERRINEEKLEAERKRAEYERTRAVELEDRLQELNDRMVKLQQEKEAKDDEVNVSKGVNDIEINSETEMEEDEELELLKAMD